MTQGFVLDSRTRFVWWGQSPDRDDLFTPDAVETQGRRVVSFATAAECSIAMGQDPTDPVNDVLDFTPVQDWLRGRRSDVDTDASLNLANFALDVATGVGTSWRPFAGAEKFAIYEKLFGAEVPWAVGLEEYVPRWSPRQVTLLRHAATKSISLIRVHIGR